MASTYKTKVAEWLKSRFPIDIPKAIEAANEEIPVYLNKFWYCLGGSPAILFMIMVATGLLLAFYYVPTADGAYESVKRITNEISFGWWIRGIHSWGATLMIVTIVLHMLRVYFTDSYRKPREFNWIFGVGLLAVAMVLGFTGYSLIYEQLSYWGIQVAANVAKSSPFIGTFASNFLKMGPEINENTIGRIFILHVAILPGALIGLVVAHIAMLRLHGVSKFKLESLSEEENKKTYKFFPHHMFTESIIAMVLVILLTILAILIPAHLGLPADPNTTPHAIKPEWYFYAQFALLKFFPSTEVFIAFMGIIVPGLIFWPFIEPYVRKIHKTLPDWIGIIGFLGFCLLTALEALREPYKEAFGSDVPTMLDFMPFLKPITDLISSMIRMIQF